MQLALTRTALEGVDPRVRSIYFFDPDGILLEFAAWTRGFTEQDVG